MAKSVIITGGNRGIGLSITRVFADAGYHVTVGARSEMDLSGLPLERVQLVQMDVRSEEGHSDLVAAAKKANGGVDCYINNAGFSEWRPLAEIDTTFFQDMMAVNLMGAMWGCKAAEKAMNEGGSIINMSSIASKRGSTNNAMYCATKFGMNGVTQSLAKELGPKGIRVNGVCPVLVPTQGLLEALENPLSPAKGDPETFLENFKIANAALGRLPTGEEVAQMCFFLASDGASGITGQNINVDCGVFPQ